VKSEKLNKHLDKLAHVFLYAALMLGVVAIYFSRFNSTRQFLVVLLMIVFYLIWGQVYHYLKRDVSQKLMLEYLIIALLSLLSAYFVLLS